ncbi:MAG: hypothetical protein EZS28_010612 [Streblomastix strix]|uniref:RRM domain-containing protein n=1 Tax=Streblomastix strix TaxID=222440 RepID=A0A5J4WG19_9EUKA|nr:MAG: hypothetical protein EZS28_010612 [Streblomastix strix]
MSEQQIQKPVEAEDLIQQNTLPLLTANQKKHLRKKNKKKKEKENKLMEQEKDEIPVQLFVFNLENYVSEDTIKHRFQECGIVESVYIPLSCSHNAGFSAQYALPFSHNRGFAFVTMKNQHDTQAALDTLNNSNF